MVTELGRRKVKHTKRGEDEEAAAEQEQEQKEKSEEEMQNMKLDRWEEGGGP